MAREQRFPQLAHWGAFTAVVEDGRLMRCEPFAADPAPSPMLESIVPRWCLAVSDGVALGVAVMATGAWYAPDADGVDTAGAANTQTLDIGTSDLTQGPNAMSCPVQISAAPRP